MDCDWSIVKLLEIQTFYSSLNIDVCIRLLWTLFPIWLVMEIITTWLTKQQVNILAEYVHHRTLTIP